MLGVIAQIEQAGDMVGGHAGGDVGVGLQQFQEIGTAFPHLHGVALDQAV